MYSPRRCLEGLAASAIFAVPDLPRAPPLCCSHAHTRLEILSWNSNIWWSAASHYPGIHYSSALFLWDVCLYWYLQEHWDLITILQQFYVVTFFNFILDWSYWISCKGKLKTIHTVRSLLDHLFILVFLARFLFCGKARNIIVTSGSDVDYMLSASGATLSSFPLQLPPAAAVIQFWYRPAGRLKELLPPPDMWAWPWRSAWLAENSVLAHLLPGGDKCACKYSTFESWRISG